MVAEVEEAMAYQQRSFPSAYMIRRLTCVQSGRFCYQQPAERLDVQTASEPMEDS